MELQPADYVLCALALTAAVTGLFRGFSGTLAFLAAIAAGADGLLIEVHNDPAHALCDGAQSLTPDQFREIMPKLDAIARCVGKKLS